MVGVLLTRMWSGYDQRKRYNHHVSNHNLSTDSMFEMIQSFYVDISVAFRHSDPFQRNTKKQVGLYKKCTKI